MPGERRRGEYSEKARAATQGGGKKKAYTSRVCLS